MEAQQTHTQSHGAFYTLTILPKNTPYIIQSNSERAFIIASLQDSIQGDYRKHYTIKQRPSTIELTAFSITRSRIILLFFAYTKPTAQAFGSQLVNMLAQYQETITPYHPIATTIHLRELSDAHDAFVSSLSIHAHHSDWEYDRYSSIGFYLHGRSGAWMKTWRMSAFYKEDPEIYRKKLKEFLFSKETSTPCASLRE